MTGNPNLIIRQKRKSLLLLSFNAPRMSENNLSYRNKKVFRGHDIYHKMDLIYEKLKHPQVS